MHCPMRRWYDVHQLILCRQTAVRIMNIIWSRWNIPILLHLPKMLYRMLSLISFVRWIQNSILISVETVNITMPSRTRYWTSNGTGRNCQTYTLYIYSSNKHKDFNMQCTIMENMIKYEIYFTESTWRDLFN